MSNRVIYLTASLIAVASIASWLAWQALQPPDLPALLSYDWGMPRVEAGKITVSGTLRVASGWTIQGPVVVKIVPKHGGLIQEKTAPASANCRWGPLVFADLEVGEYLVFPAIEVKHNRGEVKQLTAGAVSKDVP